MNRASTLDRRLTLRRATVTADAYNEPVEVWADLATVWGSRKDIGDGERWRAAEIGAEITTRFVIRWSSEVASLSPKDRLIEGGREYDIHGIKEIGRREALEITAKARAD